MFDHDVPCRSGVAFHDSVGVSLHLRIKQSDSGHQEEHALFPSPPYFITRIAAVLFGIYAGYLQNPKLKMPSG